MKKYQEGLIMKHNDKKHWIVMRLNEETSRIMIKLDEETPDHEDRRGVTMDCDKARW